MACSSKEDFGLFGIIIIHFINGDLCAVKVKSISTEFTPGSPPEYNVSFFNVVN